MVTEWTSIIGVQVACDATKDVPVRNSPLVALAARYSAGDHLVCNVLPYRIAARIGAYLAEG
jgi:hypothetical protein